MNGTKERRVKKNPQKLWSGLAIIALGAYVAISRLAPEACGVAGALVTRFIAPYTGNATLVLGVMLIALGSFLSFFKHSGERVMGVILLAFPVLIVSHAFAGAEAEAPQTIGALLATNVSRYLGAFGKWTATIILFIVSLWLIMPMLMIKGVHALIAMARRKSTPATPSPAKTHAGAKTRKPAASPGEDAAGAPIALPEQQPSPTEAQDSKPVLDDTSPASGEAAGASETMPAPWLDTEPLAGYFEETAHGMFPSVAELKRPAVDPHRPEAIQKAFAAFDVQVNIGDVAVGPSFEQYEIEPGPGVKIAKIRGVIDDVGVRLKCKAALSQRATDGALVLELPATQRISVPYGFVLENPEDDHFRLPIALGVDASFRPHSLDLAAAPHLLVAGTTGSGKSVFLRSLIASLLYHKTPNQVRMVLIDPKRVEFGIFAHMSYLAHPVVTDLEEASRAFEELVDEMERRYAILEAAGCTDCSQYIQKGNAMPAIVVVADEFADLFMSADKQLKKNCIRLAQKARACGIHMVLGTQRPSADVIDGLLKTNIPGRIALTVSSGTDSRIIIDRGGAENLTGKGDMICVTPDYREGIRMQAAILDDAEVRALIERKSRPVRFDSIAHALSWSYGRMHRPVEYVDSRWIIMPEQACLSRENIENEQALAMLNAGRGGPIKAWLHALAAAENGNDAWAVITIVNRDGASRYLGVIPCAQLETVCRRENLVNRDAVNSALEKSPEASIVLEYVAETESVARQQLESNVKQLAPDVRLEPDQREYCPA